MRHGNLIGNILYAVTLSCISVLGLTDCLQNNDPPGPLQSISGTPTNTGTSNFTVKVTDALAQADTQALSIAVSAALTITTTSLPKATVGKSYNTTLQRSGGVSPFFWSVTPALPTGLSLDTSTGKITGTPSGRNGRNL